jgi:hypothetical protein
MHFLVFFKVISEGGHIIELFENEEPFVRDKSENE